MCGLYLCAPGFVNHEASTRPPPLIIDRGLLSTARVERLRKTCYILTGRGSLLLVFEILVTYLLTGRGSLLLVFEILVTYLRAVDRCYWWQCGFFGGRWPSYHYSSALPPSRSRSRLPSIPLQTPIPQPLHGQELRLSWSHDATLSSRT